MAADSGCLPARDLWQLADGAESRLEAVTYPMPPLDSLGLDQPVHAALDSLEKSMVVGLGQTIVGCLVEPRRCLPST
jgi:hypothetical protein